MRIVSLLASATELVHAIGAGDELVARSHECDFPESVKALPVVSRPAFDVTGSSRAIDRRVRERLASGAPLYEVDDDAIARLEPDVVLTQTHCEVCAPSPADVERGGVPPLCRRQVAALRSGTLEGILAGFVEVATVLGRHDAGARLVAELRARTEAVSARTRSLPRPTVVCLEWLDPVFAMGNWGPEIVELAGGTSLLGRPGEHSTTTPWEAVLEADPDVLVVAPCGFTVDRTLSEIEALTTRPGYATLKAARAGQVYVADGNRFFNRSGPSAFESVELLAEILHPDVFPPKHRGAGWRPL
jgi:iron complex transport system substrate-binding protein